MAVNINYQEELAKLQSSIVSARSKLDQIEKNYKEAKSDEEKKAILPVLIQARKPLQLFVALQWIQLINNPATNHPGEITDEFVAKNFGSKLNMLKSLSNAKDNLGAEFIAQHYGGIVDRIVQDVEHPQYQLRIVWFATVLGKLYQGHEPTRLLQAHWEDETDLLDYVKTFVNTVFASAY